MANEDQVEHWDGEGGEHWVAEQARYDRLLEGFGRRVLDALAPAPGETVVDVGCGTGALSRAVARAVGPEGRVLGVDLSGPMLARARHAAAAEGLATVAFEQADATAFPFDGTADALTSRFGVMFFDDPPAAFAHLATGLRPGGRVAFVCWRELVANEWLTVPAAALLQHVPPPDLGGPPVDGAPPPPGPFAMADAARTRALLEGAGLASVAVEPVDEPMSLGGSAADAVAFLSSTDMSKLFLADAPPLVAERAWASVAEVLDGRATPDVGITLTGAAWLVTATKPV